MKKGILIIIIILLVCGGAFWYLSGPVDGKNNQLQIVQIEQGSGSNAIAAKLKEEGLIRNTMIFKINSKLFGYDGKYKAGSYGLKKSMSMKEQMQLIVDGKTTGKIFTIPEGNSIEKNIKIFESKDIITSKEFLNEVANGKFDYEFLRDAPKGATRLEGFLYPDQYQVSLDPSAHEVIDIMLKRFDNIFTEEYYKKAKELNLSVHQVMTVASIVEKEARTDEDKAKVASVIYNRLKVNMPLQMDSILAYIHKEDKIKASLEDTKVDSKYNPYKNKGLPPGPICSPGKASIEAALNPAKSKYIYFVASEKLDGTNVFSVTYEEFLKDKAKFDKAYKEYIKKNPGKK
ncbi:MAG: endolytic transglycosylase MltG [Anaerovoracaceae bacterium]